MRIRQTHYAVGSILCAGVVTTLSNIAQTPEMLLFLLIASIAVSIYLTVGRLQDMDKNPWLSVLVILPFAWLFFLFPKGTQGANKYGDDPRIKGNP